VCQVVLSVEGDRFFSAQAADKLPAAPIFTEDSAQLWRRGNWVKSPSGITDIGVAYHTLIPTLGMCAAGVFPVALMASGISSSVVGTMAGQVIMQGYVGFSIPVWARRLITMVPAFIVALSFNTMTAMVLSQVVLSLVLPLPMVALVVLSSRKSVMGDFVTGGGTAFAAIAATVLIVFLNVVLIRQMLV
jgi:manganese transport protein